MAAFDLGGPYSNVTPLVHISIMGVKLTAILDSGSSASILGKHAIDLLKRGGMKTIQTHQYINFAGGRFGVVNELSEVMVDYGVWSTKTHFLLLPDSPRNVIILGREFIGDSDIILFLNRGGWARGHNPNGFIPFAQCCRNGCVCPEYEFPRSNESFSAPAENELNNTMS